MTVGVIIVAGGRGARVGAGLPKQLLEIGGRTILRRAIDAFDGHPQVDRLVVVLPSELVADAPKFIGATSRPCQVTAGGATRHDSVRLGLAAMPAGPDVILVHDAARPFTSTDLIGRVIAAAEDCGAAVPALPAGETVKRVDREARVVRETIAREEVWLAQTPQGFRRSVLEAAIARPGGDSATDDAILVERAGQSVQVVVGEAANVKITTPDDLAAARARLSGPPRVGTGYDLHRLAQGRRLVLAGVEVAKDGGPLGHSDGDVVCHAVVDAMLGAAAAGDIGRHFPETDPRWKDIPGLDLVGRARAIVHAAGLAVSSVDVTVVLERPKLAPHVAAIVERLARALAVEPSRVSVKAKTNEGVDAVGRGEAIVAHAVAVLVGTASA
jgi:2-C-methyl-D-erythritol 4-phosphate cytidylyltransferase / 2-C-methyl-D-erythritol 2,4-cyclodiphosphate synthase